MTIDRYTKAVLTVIAVALVVIAARPYFPSTSWPQVLRVTPAQAQSMAAREATIPKAWGKYVSYSGGRGPRQVDPHRRPRRQAAGVPEAEVDH